MQVIAYISVVVSILALVVTSLNSWLLFSASKRVQRLNQLETDLEQQTKALIDSRIQIESARLVGQIELLSQRVAHVENQQAANKSDLSEVVKSLQQLETILTTRLAAMQVEIARQMATKDDVRELAREMKGLADTRG